MDDIVRQPDRDTSRVAYRKPQPFGMEPDVFLPGALELDADEHLWVPQAPRGVRFRSSSRGRMTRRSASARTIRTR